MTVSWRYILALPLGLLLGIGVFTGFLYSQLGIPTASSQWISDMTQKKERLAENIPGPRLLVVAGSGALFGINAQLIQQQTGVPTINMATHAGIFLDYHLYRIEKIARPGDTILLACEYEFYANRYNSETADDYFLARDPDYFRQMSLLDKIDLAIRVPYKRFQEGWKNHRTGLYLPPPITPPYSPYTPIVPGIDCLDDNGDELFNTRATQPAPKPAMRKPNGLLCDGTLTENTNGFKSLAAFIQWAHVRHITVLATFPNIVRQPDYDGPNAQKAIATITHFYTAHGVPVVGTAQEAMLPIGEFYDTVYHLTHEAALQRTQRLIPELQPYLHSSP
jgi:hypothetical protein